MNEARHYSFEELIELTETRMQHGDDQLDAVEAAHLESCAHCAERAADVRRFLRSLEIAGQPGPPAEVTERAYRLLHSEERARRRDELTEHILQAQRDAAELTDDLTSARAHTSWKERIERIAASTAGAIQTGASEIAARLVGDSWGDLAFSVRGGETAVPRLLLFETETHTVSVALHTEAGPEDTSFELEGQIAPKTGIELPDCRARLTLADGTVRETETSPLGEFHFAESGVPKNLEVRIGSTVVHIGPLPESDVS